MSVSTLENSGVLRVIRANMGRFTASLANVGNYVLRNPSSVIESTAEQLSKAIHVSEASIVRFCKELGFKGYTDFRLRLAKDLGADNTKPVPENIAKGDSAADIIKKIIISEQEDIKFTSEMLNYRDMLEAVSMIRNAKRIGVFGVGSSYVVAYDLHWHLTMYGKNIQVQQDNGLQLALANSLTPLDLAIGISISGESTIPVKTLEIARDNGVPTLCITQNPRSQITNCSDCALISYTKSYMTHDLATSSRISQLVMLDALCTAYAATEWDDNAEKLRINHKYIRENQFGG